MYSQTTYTEIRAHLADWLDQVEQSREVVIINRRGHEAVALISADELRSIMETAHLLRSPRNARRLNAALDRALRQSGRPQSLTALKRELGFDEEE